MRILGIETSCDETAVCVIEADGEIGRDFHYRVLGNALLSQTAVHAPYGGVFPNLAKREHEKNLVPLLERALAESGLNRNGTTSIGGLEDILKREQELRRQLGDFFSTHSKPDIDVIAVTHGPGLEPALWVGINFAKALSAAWHIPVVPINHMEGHMIISMMDIVSPSSGTLTEVRFPLLSLLISGGHTELVLSREWMQYALIGQTRDDAVGEAFDKVARLMGLPYPGGPEIEQLATRARNDPSFTSKIRLPRPMIDSDDFDFSFAGLKTAVRKVVESEQPLTEAVQLAIAHEFENACADVLVAKTMKAIEEYNARTIVVGGGVSANAYIRARLADAIRDYGFDAKLLIPPRDLATDNAIMIALAGSFRAARGEFSRPKVIQAQGNLSLS